MSVGRAKHLAIQHAGQLEIGAIHRAACHLRNSVGADRAGAYPFETLDGISDDCGVVHGALIPREMMGGLIDDRPARSRDTAGNARPARRDPGPGLPVWAVRYPGPAWNGRSVAARDHGHDDPDWTCDETPVW